MNQESYLKLLHGRLHEINNGLTDLLRRHDLEISTRTEECKRRHIRLAQKCLQLATKTQVLRNRGYAMDSTEEELRQKLMRLEKLVLDPAIAGRGEEIWARMVGVRERARLLVAEYERVGRAVGGKEESLDDETGKKVKKVCLISRFLLSVVFDDGWEG